jgi:hypothetical protein
MVFDASVLVLFEVDNSKQKTTGRLEYYCKRSLFYHGSKETFLVASVIDSTVQLLIFIHSLSSIHVNTMTHSNK